MADEKVKNPDATGSAMLDILREKDNLIVSLKESSTRRDILNEKQIRLLSEDNQSKLNQLNDLQLRYQNLDAKLTSKEAELSVLKVTEDKLSIKISDIKIAFEKYKSQVRISLDQIKSSIQNELTRREEYKNKIIDELKDNYIKLESHIQEVDNYYREIIAEITKKQGMAKKFIRHALTDLQEALSLLDLSHADYIEPTKIKEEFAKIAEGSTNLFDEFKEMRGLPQGQTVIENIEHVNIQLSQVPEIEGVFKDITDIRKASQLKEGAEKQGIPPKEEGGAAGAEKKKPEAEGGKPDEGEKGLGGKPAKAAELSEDRAEKKEEKEKKGPEDEIQEIIFKRGRNYAPFNWREILGDIQLKRFASFIESCIKAEKSGNYMKALGLYKTIREQPGIANSIAGKLLDDHIEFLEDLIKRRYSIKYRPPEMKEAEKEEITAK